MTTTTYNSRTMPLMNGQVRTASTSALRKLLDVLLLIVTLLHSAGVLTRVLGGIDSGVAATEAGNTLLSQLITGTITIFALALSYPKLPTVWRLLHRETAYLLLLTYSFVSSLWSDLPFVNLFHLFRYQATFLLIALYLATRFQPREIFRILSNLAVFIGLVCIPADAILGHPEQLVPGMVGVFPQKNAMGTFMLLGMLGLIWDEHPWSLKKALKFSLLLVLLGLSQSATAAVVFLAIVFVAATLYFHGFERFLLAAILAGGAIAAFVAVPDFLGRLLATGDKTTELTGRGAIWAFVITKIVQRPILGWGLGGFWAGNDTSIKELFNWNPSHAHNGYLETLLEFGIVGLTLLFFCLWSSVRLALRAIRSGRVERGRMLLYIVFVLALHDLTETDFLAPTVTWFFFLLAIFCCAWQEHLQLLEASEDGEPNATAAI